MLVFISHHKKINDPSFDSTCRNPYNFMYKLVYSLFEGDFK